MKENYFTFWESLHNCKCYWREYDTCSCDVYKDRVYEKNYNGNIWEDTVVYQSCLCHHFEDNWKL